MNKRVLLSPVVAGSGISHNLVAFGGKLVDIKLE